MPEQSASIGITYGDAVLALRRVMRRATLAALESPALPPSEAELLVCVSRSAGLTVNEAARELTLAPNTVSTLVGRMCEAGFLERRSDPDDRRSARLHLTDAGTARMAAWRSHQVDVLGRAIRALSSDDRAALEASLPAMRRFAEAIEALDRRPTQNPGPLAP